MTQIAYLISQDYLMPSDSLIALVIFSQIFLDAFRMLVRLSELHHKQTQQLLPEPAIQCKGTIAQLYSDFSAKLCVNNCMKSAVSN